MAILKSKLIVGTGDFLDIAFNAWRSKVPNVDVKRHDVAQDRSHYFDLAFLDEYSPGETSMFAAFDNRFLNFKRLELMGAIKGRGFEMEPYIGAGAVIGTGAKIGENSFISEGAIVGAEAKLGYNVFIGSRAVVGYAAEIGRAAWIEAAVVVGRRSRVGAHTTVGLGVIVADGVEFGRYCLVERPGVYRESVAEKTYHLAGFDFPVSIFN